MSLNKGASYLAGLALLLTALAAVAGCGAAAGSPGDGGERSPAPRVVSLAPSITEVLFSLGLGDHVAGVTRYCDYPAEAKGLPKVGGYFDINYEAILALEPDVVVLLAEHREPRQKLARLGVKYLQVDHSSVEGILESITLIGRFCGAEPSADRLRRDLETRVERISGRIPAGDRPRVMVAVGRSLQDSAAGEVYVSGGDGFYHELITLAGGRNAYTERTLKFPAMSAEGVARLDPDIIIEMVPAADGETAARMLSFWTGIPALSAVRTGRVHVVAEDYAVVPGPRFILLLEKMAVIIRPEGPTR